MGRFKYLYKFIFEKELVFLNSGGKWYFKSCIDGICVFWEKIELYF